MEKKGDDTKITMELMEKCEICPHRCGANRLKGEKGMCGAGASLRIASVSLHKWEEPFLSGERGSGAIFFSHCPLKCVFCQNYKISQKGRGKDYSLQEFAEACLDLQGQGAHNINLVSPTQYTPLIAAGLRLAKKQGLTLPVIYNTNGYDRVESLSLLDGLVDIYLPDLKYYSDVYAKRYSAAPDYFQVATQAILAMYDQVGNPCFNEEEGILQKGLVIRHLILPGRSKDSKRVLDWICRELPKDVYVSLMGQFTPVYKSREYTELSRTLLSDEYEKIINYFLDIGLENGFRQDLSAADPAFIPDF